MEQFLQALVFGLATGGVVAVSAIGLTLAYGVTGFINFAYGELLTIAAFGFYAASKGGLPPAFAAVVAVAIAAASSVTVARAFYEPLRNRGPLPLLITSIGVAFLVQNVMQIAFGASPKPFPVPLLRPWLVGSVFIPKVQAIILLVALLTMVAVHLLLSRTLLGRKLRATADNDALARVSGIRTHVVERTLWLLSGLLAGVGGILLGLAQNSIRPTSGFSFLLVVFAAALLGGIGNAYGAMAGAVIVGLAMDFGATYVSADYTLAVAFVALVVVLLVRPSGLFGSASEPLGAR